MAKGGRTDQVRWPITWPANTRESMLAYWPGTAMMEERFSASRWHVRSATMRWPADASLGMRAMQASKESPCVP